MMARSDDDQVKYIESSDFVTFLKSQGVEFLLSSNGKVNDFSFSVLFWSD